MNQASTINEVPQSLDEMVQAELGHADALVGSLGSVLRHLLANDDHSLFSDEIVARLRGMTNSLARQLLFARAMADDAADPTADTERDLAALSSLLQANGALLGHIHAVALEHQLTNRMQSRQTIDPVLSPLLQALIASSDTATANTAMAALAAQARFEQRQRRMELALDELPGDLFHGALLALRSLDQDADDPAAEKASEKLRKTFDESRSRVGLFSRLTMGLGNEAAKALAIENAGVAFFVTALGIASGMDRDLAILSTNDRQTIRLALALRTAGLKPDAIAEQFAFMHPGLSLPEDFDHLRNDRAGEILSSSNPNLAA